MGGGMGANGWFWMVLESKIHKGMAITPENSTLLLSLSILATFPPNFAITRLSDGPGRSQSV